MSILFFFWLFSFFYWQQLLVVVVAAACVLSLAAAGVSERIRYISTAGGAFLEWLEGKELPGVAALEQA